MNWMSTLQKNDFPLYIAAVVLLIPALFIGMGYMPLMSDEGIRALVALEMDFDQHYFTPTLNGDYYFNKPPLYNWLVLAFFNLFDSHSLYVFRLPNLLMGLIFGVFTYAFARNYFSKKEALLSALLFLTCGRVLFNDFYLGLMALTHGLVLFINFWVIYTFHKKERWLALFTISYFLIALTFLMKGLQGVAAQAITLPVFFLWRKDFWRLFSWQHFVGIFTFVGSIAIYMGIYYETNPAVFDQYIATLWDQSEQRTFLEYTWLDNVLHIVSYPIKVVYEILPYGFIVFLMLRKSWINQIKTHDFLLFCALMFTANNLVYLASPFWHARYIFFLFPLLFILIVYTWKNRNQQEKAVTFFNHIWWIIAAIAALGALVYPFTPFAQNIPNALLISLVLAAVLASLTYLMFALPESRLILFVLVLITARYGADLLYIKSYSHQIKEFEHRDLAIKAAQFSEGTALHLFKAPYLSEDVSFYIARERGETLKREFKVVNSTDYYIVDSTQKTKLQEEGVAFKEHFTFKTRNENFLMHIVQFEKGFSLQ